MFDDRAEVLARRVRWLDRYRRRIAITAAVTLALTMMFATSWVLGAEWPVFHARLLAGMVGVIAWWLVEVALAWITALWETQADRLLRDRGLPPMRVVTGR
jgi:polyferredoxin